MFKIAWKSFWYNIKNFVVFFLSAVFSVAMIFGFMYLSQLTEEISVGGLPSDAGTQLRHSVVAIFIVSICIMVYSARTYIRSRMKDY